MSAGSRDRPQVVTDTAGLQDAPDLVIEMHCSGERVGAGPPLEHRDGAPTLGQKDGQHVADRSIADDGDIGVRHGAHAVRSGWCPQALIRRSGGCRSTRR